MRVEVRPALQMEEMFAEVVALAEAGRMTARGLPRNLLTLARLARRYDQEAHAPLLSVAVQRFLLAPLVALGRLTRSASRAPSPPPRPGLRRLCALDGQRDRLLAAVGERVERAVGLGRGVQRDGEVDRDLDLARVGVERRA